MFRIMVAMVNTVMVRDGQPIVTVGSPRTIPTVNLAFPCMDSVQNRGLIRGSRGYPWTLQVQPAGRTMMPTTRGPVGAPPNMLFALCELSLMRLNQ